MAAHKILFVDDDEFIRKIYTDRLSASGFELSVASSGAEAERLLESTAFDLVCLDYMLADKTGLDILKWMRQEKKLNMPVIVFSASGHDAKIKEFMDAGATEYIQKDHVVPSEFVEKIKNLQKNNMERHTVLIVEDKDEFRKIYGDRLRFGGYNVLDATDGEEALEVLHSKEVDVIITDINMPRKDGYQLIEEVKADPKLADIPILVMSVFDTGDHLKKARELGAADYLVKGMHTPNVVLEKVQALISKK